MTMNSMLVPGAWWPVSRTTVACSPSARQCTQRGAPVGDVHRVEVRLEELVLEQQPVVRVEHRVDLLQRVGEPVLPAAQVVLARVVGAVGQPDLQVGRAGLPP